MSAATDDTLQIWEAVAGDCAFLVAANAAMAGCNLLSVASSVEPV